MKHTLTLTALTLACSLQAQVSWTANLSNPAFPTASGFVEATIPANTALDPWVYFNASWQNIVVIETMIQTEVAGNVSGSSVDNFKLPIAWFPSEDLHGLEAKMWFNNYNDTLTGTFVPEPSTYALLTGLGLCAFAVWRKRGV